MPGPPPTSETEPIVWAETTKRAEANAYYWGVYKTTDEMYSYCIEVTSPEVYCITREEDIFYDGKSIDQYDNIDVKIYNTNKDLGIGTESFIVLQSKNMIDTKKIMVRMYGLKEYDATKTWNNFEEYLNLGLEEFSVKMPIKDVTQKNNTDRVLKPKNKIGEGLQLNNESIYYFNSDGKTFVEGNTLWKELNIVGLNTDSVDNFLNATYNFHFASAKNINGTEYDIDSVFDVEGLSIEVKKEDNKIYVGIKADNCKSWDEYSGEVPKIIVFGEFRTDKNELVWIDDVKYLVHSIIVE